MQDQTLQRFQEVSARLNSTLDSTDVHRRAIEAATVMMDAEAGSLFLLDSTTGELSFNVAFGEKGQAVRDACRRCAQEVARVVAQTGEPVIVNDLQRDPRFFRQAHTGHRFTTRNMVCVPVTAHGQLLGVLQAFNRKGREHFSAVDLNNFIALAHQVGIAIDNATLYQEIEQLLEGFISASVEAMESLDPCTSWHSQRVAALTVRLAEAVSRTESGPYAHIRFSAAQLKELRYAAVLHDFGKIGVRAQLLAKAKKLDPGQLALVRARFDLIKRTLETESLREKLALYETTVGEERSLRLAHLDRLLAQHLREVDEIYATLLTFNHPAHDGSTSHERLVHIAARTYRSFDGLRPYLTEEEVQALSITEGSLTKQERQEIEGHVTQTFEFLSKIPWMRSLKNVPEIAWCHHERLDGSGYPRGLTTDRIPLQARMMAICDIYDALTASDRPYKSAISIGAALQQLNTLARQGKLDVSLLEIFVAERVYETTPTQAKRVA